MGLETKIAWTDHTWNVAVGCTKVDEDCKFCYMYRDSMDSTRFDPKTVRRTTSVFGLPLKIKEPSKIFISSYTDWLHPAIDPYRFEMWNIIEACPHHTFQMLTKRPERLDDETPLKYLLNENMFPKNVWMGTSCGSQPALNVRATSLLSSKWQGIKFLSLEPLWERITLKSLPTELLPQLSWLIIGGESGNETGKYRYRPCRMEWIESLVNECRSHGIPVFIKQLGTHLSKELGLKSRHGTDPAEWPEHLRIQEFPNTNIEPWQEK